MLVCVGIRVHKAVCGYLIWVQYIILGCVCFVGVFAKIWVYGYIIWVWGYVLWVYGVWVYNMGVWVRIVGALVQDIAV